MLTLVNKMLKFQTYSKMLQFSAEKNVRNFCSEKVPYNFLAKITATNGFMSTVSLNISRTNNFR